MLKNKSFWYGNMAFAVFGWLFFIYGLFVEFDSSTMDFLWRTVVLLWGIGHPLEMIFSIPIGKKAGVSIEKTITKTMIFGIMWWIPLKLGVFDE